MIDWVKKISDHAKARKSDFLIIPQNSPELVDTPEYLAAIEGLGKESIWYESEDKIDPAATNSAIAFIDKVIAAGKFVLTIDYQVNTSKRCEFISAARLHGFVQRVVPVALDVVEDYPTC